MERGGPPWSHSEARRLAKRRLGTPAWPPVGTKAAAHGAAGRAAGTLDAYRARRQAPRWAVSREKGSFTHIDGLC